MGTGPNSLRYHINVNALNYPIICFNNKAFYVETDSSNLTRCSAGILKGGWFRGLLIVDSTGQTYRIRDAKKVRTIGFSWSSLIFGPMIEIALEQDGEPFLTNIDEVREKMYKSSVRWHGLESRIGFEELKELIDRAQSVAELIQVLL